MNCDADLDAKEEARCYPNAPDNPSGDVKELVGRLRDEGDKMDARFGTRLCDEAATMLQAQEEEIERWKALAEAPDIKTDRANERTEIWRRHAMNLESDVATLTEKLEAQEKEYKKLEAKFWKVRDYGLRVEDALKVARMALERIAANNPEALSGNPLHWPCEIASAAIRALSNEGR